MSVNRNYRIGWWLIVITIVLLFSFPFLFMENILGAKTATVEYAFALLGEILLLIPIGLGAAYIKLTQKDEKNILAIKKVPMRLLPLSVLLIVGAQYFITYMTLPLQFVLMMVFGAETATTQMAVPTNAWEFIIAFITLCVVAPIIEELLCRGILVKILKGFGIVTVLIVTSLAFTLLHFEARTFIQMFFVALLLGTFRLCTGSIIPGIIMHAVNNFISLCQITFFGENFGFLTVVCTVMAFLFVPIMYITFVKNKKYLTPEDILYTRDKPVFSLGACICIGLFILYNLLMILERVINL